MLGVDMYHSGNFHIGTCQHVIQCKFPMLGSVLNHIVQIYKVQLIGNSFNSCIEVSLLVDGFFNYLIGAKSEGRFFSTLGEGTTRKQFNMHSICNPPNPPSKNIIFWEGPT